MKRIDRFVTIAVALLLVSLAHRTALPASAATTAQKAAIAGLISIERARGNKDVETPSCSIVETYAQCDFAMYNQNEDVNEWLHTQEQ